MNLTRRVAFKTVLICLGIFILLSAGVVYYFYNYMDFDTEPRMMVYTAATDLHPGDTINESMIVLKEVRESSLVPSMVSDSNEVIGKKALIDIKAGDYLTNYNFLDSSLWYEDDERFTVLEVDITRRLAGLVKKDSLVDILVELNGKYDLPKVVLPRVKIIDLIDELGNSVSDMPSEKTLFAKLLLSKEERDLLFAAQESGTLIVELYCNTIQAPAQQRFQIPQTYFLETLIEEKQ